MLNRATLRAISTDAEAALASVAKKHGVQIDVGGIRYNADHATMKVEIAAIASDGTAKTKEATDFERYADSYGLKASDLGREFNYLGDTFTLIGAKPRSTKYPLLAKRSDGKVYKLPLNVVKYALRDAA